jgi:hypothetical protein
MGTNVETNVWRSADLRDWRFLQIEQLLNSPLKEKENNLPVRWVRLLECVKITK